MNTKNNGKYEGKLNIMQYILSLRSILPVASSSLEFGFFRVKNSTKIFNIYFLVTNQDRKSFII